MADVISDEFFYVTDSSAICNSRSEVTMASEKRRYELSLLNVFFCLAVIMIHILSYPVTAFTVGSPKYSIVMLTWRLLSFVVQGFIFLAGLRAFLTHKDEMNYPRYLSVRLYSVILPYLVCFGVYYLFYMMVYSYPKDPTFIADNLVFGKLSSHFYFIPLLVQFDLLMPLWKRIVKHISPMLVIPAAFVLSCYLEKNLPGIIQRIFGSSSTFLNDRFFTTYLSFWILGCYAGKYYDRFKALLKNNFELIYATFGLMTMICIGCSYITYNGIYAVSRMNTVHHLYAASAILFFTAIAQRLAQSKAPRPALVGVVDRHSYNIYLWHMLVLFVADSLVASLGLEMQSLAFLFRVVFVYTVTISAVTVFGKLYCKLLNINTVRYGPPKPRKLGYNRRRS